MYEWQAFIFLFQQTGGRETHRGDEVVNITDHCSTLSGMILCLSEDLLSSSFSWTSVLAIFLINKRIYSIKRATSNRPLRIKASIL